MSKLEDLIAELCPDGVEYKTLKDVTEFIKDGTHASLKSIDVGYPLLSAKDVYDGLVHIPDDCRKITEKDYQDIYKKYKLQIGDVLLTIVGSIGRTAIVDDASSEVAFQRSVGIIRTKSILIPQFLVHLFGTRKVKIQLEKGTSQSAQGGVYLNSLGKITIPVPPLPVQSEIVRILDNFTELTAGLTAELTAELTARKKQYEYYCKKAFEFSNSNDTKIVKLSEIADIGTGSSNTNEQLEIGEYPFFVRSQEVRRKNEYEYDETAIITSGDGVGVGKIFHFIEGKYALHQRAYRIHITDSQVMEKYFFYYMKSTFYEYIQKNAVNSSVTSVRRPMMNNYTVPIPTLQEQQRIVELLDRFDTLCNDISTGLPAEIEARQKQYEFYRDKLLTFKELS